jgi:hypothetical protein
MFIIQIILGIAGLAILEVIDRKTNGKITRIRRRGRKKR